MPYSETPRLGFVGAGRLARCVARVWARAGYPVTAIASRSAGPARELADWVLADRLPVRFQMQLHKVLWGNVPGK